MSSQHNTFQSLLQIDVSKHIEKKGQFTYLSWPYAVSQLRLADPNAKWEVRRFNGLPFLPTELGYFVEVAVTVNELTLSQIHPVLDSKNRPIECPTSFDINTSIQRCLVKAIALHGLGLSIYAGEDLIDLPNPEQHGSPKLITSPARTPEHRDSEATSNDGITPAQLKFIQQLIQQTNSSVSELLDYFGYPTLDSIPRSAVNRVIKALQTKRRAA